MSLAFGIGLLLFAGLLSALLSWRFTHPASSLHVLDHPNERSLHSHPVPRTGGVAILSALLAAVSIWQIVYGLPQPLAWIAAGLFGLGSVAFVEDRYGVPRRYRLVAQLLAASVLIAAGLATSRLHLPGVSWQLPGWLAVAFTLLFVVWMVNLYNFMDGMDGFAAGMAVIGFGGLALLGRAGDHPGFVCTNLLIAAAACGFLLWNFPPARIFMGDAGASGLGFLAAAMSLWGASEQIFPLWTALLVFSPFVVDATVTLIARLLRGERVWEAHRTHHYQRLVRAGWGHRKTVLWAYALMGLCVATAVRGLAMPPTEQWTLIGAWAGIYWMIALKTGLLERRSGSAGS